MRIIIFLIFLSILAPIFNGCNKTQEKTGLEAINAYVENNVNNIRYDIRIFDPPPPPEWQDSLKHNGRTRPDSVIKHLKPLKVYVTIDIEYDSAFISDLKPVKGFSFVKDIKPYKASLSLDSTSFSKKQGIILEFLSRKDFFLKHERIQHEEDYGGIVSFRNLICSVDGSRAVFEVSYFKGKLNASTAIVYAEKQDGTWIFHSKPISIS
ncbi:hypothetical protein HCG49_02900 [Arenibacter sp. 6A1]|uniref:hypothetical protein n=1 Tax=Arenibacter sp. 6A1 TaxID=2720391 RepID=UPI001444A32E|nr:hypothetical protein [Arenibacter sp. 6A1]NKI25507.1 hypothetical protein [Arenibacter sp. 6A1]